jgi:hypothetical protein
MLILAALTICASLLAVSLGLNYIAYIRAPQMIFDMGDALVNATIKKYLPDLQEGQEGGAGRPTEGIMGFLNTPMGQQIANIIMQKIQGGATGAAAKAGNIYR